MPNDNQHENLYARMAELSTKQANTSERLNYIEKAMNDVRSDFSATALRLSDEIKKLTDSIRESLTERQLEFINLNNSLLNEIRSNSDNLTRLNAELTRREQQAKDQVKQLTDTNEKLEKRVDELEDYVKLVRSTLTLIKWVGGLLGTSGIVALIKLFLNQ